MSGLWRSLCGSHNLFLILWLRQLWQLLGRQNHSRTLVFHKLGAWATLGYICTLVLWGVHKSWCQLAKKHTHGSSMIRINYFRYCASIASSKSSDCRLPHYHRVVHNSFMIRPTTIADEFCYTISGRLSLSMEEIHGFLDTQIHEFVTQVVIHTSSEVLCCCRINANSSHKLFAALGRRRNSGFRIIRRKEFFSPEKDQKITTLVEFCRSFVIEKR